MSLAEVLIHTCTIQEPVNADNPYHEQGATWRNIDTLVACRLMVETQVVVDTATAAESIITMYTLLLPANAVVDEGYRITDLVLEEGEEPGVDFTIEAMKPQRQKTAIHHIALELKKVGP